MKAVIQRVLSASVAVDDKTISSIGHGLLVLVGIDKTDEPSDSSMIIKKVLAMKLFDGEDGSLWKRSVQEVQGEVLCVSQFTLYAGFKGTKPEFRDAMSPADSRTMFAAFLDEIKSAYTPDKIKSNQFGVTGTVSLINDGPTTILLDSKEKKGKSSSSSAGASGSSTPLPITPSGGAAADTEEARAKQAAKAAKKVEWETKQALKKAQFGSGEGQGQSGEKGGKEKRRKDGKRSGREAADVLEGNEGEVKSNGDAAGDGNGGSGSREKVDGLVNGVEGVRIEEGESGRGSV